jgi:hypothetical protein
VLFNPEYNPDTFSVANGEIMVGFAITQHVMTRDEARSWIQDLQWLGREGRYFFSLNLYLFLTSKATIRSVRTFLYEFKAGPAGGRRDLDSDGREDFPPTIPLSGSSLH